MLGSLRRHPFGDDKLDDLVLGNSFAHERILGKYAVDLLARRVGGENDAAYARLLRSGNDEQPLS